MWKTILYLEKIWEQTFTAILENIILNLNTRSWTKYSFDFLLSISIKVFFRYKYGANIYLFQSQWFTSKEHNACYNSFNYTYVQVCRIKADCFCAVELIHLVFSNQWMILYVANKLILSVFRFSKQHSETIIVKIVKYSSHCNCNKANTYCIFKQCICIR